MDAGMITHFGSFEEVREAGAAFALASSTGKTDTDKVVAVKESATGATVVDEEEDEELNWVNEQASRRGAYNFYLKCTGVLQSCGLFGLITIWSGLGIFATGYLSSACLD
jgi:hypothetical protein